jgi:hypothetical protein
MTVFTSCTAISNAAKPAFDTLSRPFSLVGDGQLIGILKI